jgi:parallel beta helix pectate lyase-like protein
MSRSIRVFAAAVLLALALPALAAAHIERPSFWPDPAPDNSVKPAAGGKVPKARTLSSALKKPGDTFVVCQKNSLSLMKKSVKNALKNGYNYRPTDPKTLSQHRADQLLKINTRLAKLCKFSEIQPAVTAAGNNDRVVVMPGLYTEPTARAAKTFDPACDKYEINNEFGDPGALAYDYHLHCPNDQNLIAVMGQTAGPNMEPKPKPEDSRHGIPKDNLGKCIRCNLQLEGSGVGPDDVIIDAGDASKGNKGPPGAKKDVGVRADRADGFVLRNVTVRHAKEHGIYVIESDGYLLDRFKTFYHGLYGTLTFVEDHGLTQHCEAVGNSDSGLYPGAPADTGDQRPAGTDFRYNQEIKFCDSHHNMAGYSATNGNAMDVHDNNFYDNALGVQTDVVTSPGHPGFPGDSELFHNNNIYSNNFDIYSKDSDVPPAFPFPTGTGLWIAGGNHHQVRNNNIYDNWRRGTMVFAVPDVIVCGPQGNNYGLQPPCDPAKTSTSFMNQTYSNVMGLSPDGKVLPNGTDFWWDDFPDNTGNCWYMNTGPKPITTNPSPLPNCNDGKNPEMSVGKGNAQNQAELGACAASFETRTYDPSSGCPWFVVPPKPGSAAARSFPSAKQKAQMRKTFADFCRRNETSRTCAPYRDQLNAP